LLSLANISIEAKLCASALDRKNRRSIAMIEIAPRDVRR
jgi:hypothetical protein